MKFKISGKIEVKIRWIGVFICILVYMGCSKAKEGEWKGSVTAEWPNLYKIKNNYLYAPEHDENGFPVLKRYKIIWNIPRAGSWIWQACFHFIY